MSVCGFPHASSLGNLIAHSVGNCLSSLSLYLFQSCYFTLKNHQFYLLVRWVGTRVLLYISAGLELIVNLEILPGP